MEKDKSDLQELLNKYKKVSSKEEDNNEPKCKELKVITDIEGHDYIFTGYFEIEKTIESIVVKTFKDKDHKEIIGKYIINFDFIVSLEYKY